MLIDLHSHSTLGDGTLIVEQMVVAAERRGYEAFAVTDHAQGDDPAFAEKVAELRNQIDRLQSQVRMHLFAGAEVS